MGDMERAETIHLSTNCWALCTFLLIHLILLFFLLVRRGRPQKLKIQGTTEFAMLGSARGSVYSTASAVRSPTVSVRSHASLALAMDADDETQVAMDVDKTCTNRGPWVHGHA